MRIAGKLTDRGAVSAVVRGFKARGVKRGRVYLRRYNTPRANPRPEQYLGRSTRFLPSSANAITTFIQVQRNPPEVKPFLFLAQSSGNYSTKRR